MNPVETPQPAAESTVENPQPAAESPANSQSADGVTAVDTADTANASESAPTADGQPQAAQRGPPNRTVRRHPMFFPPNPRCHPFLPGAPINGGEDCLQEDMPELDMNSWLREPIPGQLQLAADPVFVGVTDELDSMDELENWFVNNPIDGPLESVEVIVEDGTETYRSMAAEWTQ